MCGFAYVYHLDSELDLDLAYSLASEYLSNRGPDYYKSFSNKQEFAYQSILAIQSDINNPLINLKRDESFCLYNGEIYSKDEGLNQKYDNNLDNINALDKNIKLTDYLAKVDGMYAICQVNKIDAKVNSINIARDPSGEKHLFYYISNKLIVISSVPGFIKEYCNLSSIDNDMIIDYIHRRHFIPYNKTAIKGIEQIPPGHCISFSTFSGISLISNRFKGIKNLIDSTLIRELKSISYQDYRNYLDSTFKSSFEKMLKAGKNNKSLSIISGGIDSTLSSYYLNDLNIDKMLSICLDFEGKESPAAISTELAAICNVEEHILFKPSIDDYLNSLLRCQKLLAGPVNTHSFPSSMLIARKAKELKCRIIYGGEGADELFLGYPCYSKLFLDFNGELDVRSDYTSRDELSSSSNLDGLMLNELKNAYDIYNSLFTSQEAYVKASAWVDYHFQLSSVGYFANDLALSDLGIEGRSVFARSEIIKLGLATPVDFLLHENKNKFCLHDLFKMHIKYLPLNKSGFAGFPNETLNYLDSPSKWKIWDVLGYRKNIDSIDRAEAWKYINLEWFLYSL